LAARKETCFNFCVVRDAAEARRLEVGDDEQPASGERDGALARSQAARRRRVLDATMVLARDGGFDGVQMRDVAAEANVAIGTVYRYFNSKERLLLEMMVEQQQDLRRHLRRHPAEGATSAVRVTVVLQRANAALRRYPDVAVAMVRAFGASRNENADVVERVSEIMTSIITGAIGSDTERDRQVARILTQVWLSSLIGWAGGVDPVERVDDDLDIAAHLLLDR
jgi:AcrR family transcriptional regulator